MNRGGGSVQDGIFISYLCYVAVPTFVPCRGHMFTGPARLNSAEPALNDVLLAMGVRAEEQERANANSGAVFWYLCV